MLAAAALAGVEVDLQQIDMTTNWKTPEFLAKHPLGYLPVLEDGDLNLSECAAIAEYGELILPAYRSLIGPGRSYFCG